MSAIRHQQQPTPWTCNQACLAMLLGRPVSDVVACYPDKGMSSRRLMVALDECGIHWNAFMYSPLLCDGYYILGVPSLNITGGGHAILVRAEDDLLEEVFDPNRGIPGKRYYTALQEEDPNAVMLQYWEAAIYVRPGGTLPSPAAQASA